MKQKKLRACLKQKIAELTAGAKILDEDFEKESIHQFRVNVKALKALLRLLSQQKSKVVYTAGRKFTRLYHITGAIRDAQLEAGIVATHPMVLPGYAEVVANTVADAKSEWKIFYSKKQMQALAKRVKNFDIEDIRTTDLINFIHSRRTNIFRRISAKNITDESLHSIRKDLKDIILITDFAEKYWKAAFRKTKHIDIDLLKKLADLIGDYNDKRMLLRNMVLYYGQQAPTTRKKMEPHLEAQAKEKRLMRQQKKEIISALKLNFSSGTLK